MTLFWKMVRAAFNNFDHPQLRDFSQNFSGVLRTLTLEVFFKESSEKNNKFHGSFKIHLNPLVPQTTVPVLTPR